MFLKIALSISCMTGRYQIPVSSMYLSIVCSMPLINVEYCLAASRMLLIIVEFGSI